MTVTVTVIVTVTLTLTLTLTLSLSLTVTLTLTLTLTLPLTVTRYDRGLGSRQAELLAIAFQSGWRDGDTPAGLEAGGASSLRAPAPAVLTGNAWHFGHGRC